MVMLLRNLALSRGLCNSTRLIVTSVSVERSVLQVRVLSGAFAGDTAFIPRIKLRPPEGTNSTAHAVRPAFA